MQRNSVNLTNDCSENQLNYNNNLPAILNKNRDRYKRETVIVICHLLSGPRQPTFIEITEITFFMSCRKFKIFPFILFGNDEWPKAANSPLTNNHNS